MIMDWFHKFMNSLKICFTNDFGSLINTFLEPSSSKLLLEESSRIVWAIFVIFESQVFDQNISNIGSSSNQHNSEPK